MDVVTFMAPLFVVFYNLRPLGEAWQLAPLCLLGTWALVVNARVATAAETARVDGRRITPG